MEHAGKRRSLPQDKRRKETRVNSTIAKFKIFRASKDTVNQMKNHMWNGRKSLQMVGVNIPKIHGAPTTQQQNIRDPKTARTRHCSKEEMYEWLTAHDKTFRVTNVRQLHIRTARYHLRPITVAAIETEQTKPAGVGEDVVRREAVGRTGTARPLWETVCRRLVIMKTRTAT